MKEWTFEHCTREEWNEYERLRRLAFPEQFRERARRKRLRHPERIKAQKHASYLRNRNRHKKTCRLYAIRNAEKIGEYQQQYRKRNKARIAALARRRYHADIEKTRAYENTRKKARRSSNISVRIMESLRQRVRGALRPKRYKVCDRTKNLIGCPIADFKMYLESKFESGMSWENYGSEWEIDHIMPCAIFDLSRQDHQRRCFHFSNMQPLWGKKNRQKSCKVLTNQFNLL